MRKVLLILLILLAIMSESLLIGCKSKEEIKTEDNIRAYITQESKGVNKVKQIKHLGVYMTASRFQQSMPYSKYRVTVVPVHGSQRSTTIELKVDLESGEVLGKDQPSGDQ